MTLSTNKKLLNLAKKGGYLDFDIWISCSPVNLS